MLTLFINKTEVTRTMTMTLPCWVRILLRNIISHLGYFFRIVTRFHWRTRWSGASIHPIVSGHMTRTHRPSWQRPPRWYAPIFTLVGCMKEWRPTFRLLRLTFLQPILDSHQVHGIFHLSPCRTSRWSQDMLFGLVVIVTQHLHVFPFVTNYVILICIWYLVFGHGTIVSLLLCIS